MANYRELEVNLIEVLQSAATPRALGLKAAIQGNASTLLQSKMKISGLEEARQQAQTSVELADIDYLIELVAPIARYRSGASVGRSWQNATDQYNPDLLRVTYIALNQTIHLPGALLSFDDNYRPSFRREEVYGRMDPIATYQGTGRTIAIEWEMNLASSFSPQESLAAFQDLIKFMYPVYQDTSYNELGTGTLVAPPVLRLEVLNGGTGTLGLMQGYNQGLLCIVDGFSYNRFSAAATAGELNIIRSPVMAEDEGSSVRPTHLTISLQLTVLHEEAKVGFVYSKTGPPGSENTVSIQFGQGEGYPYGYGTTLDLASIPPNPRINRLTEEIGSLGVDDARTAADVALARHAEIQDQLENQT